MRNAVVRINVDPLGDLGSRDYELGVRRLIEQGRHVVATPAEHMPAVDCEIELIVDDTDLDHTVAALVEECGRVFPTPVRPGPVTFISRGTDADVLGILRGFGLTGDVVRETADVHEVVTVTVDREGLRRVSESRLHTALEAALNAEVVIAVRERLAAT